MTHNTETPCPGLPTYTPGPCDRGYRPSCFAPARTAKSIRVATTNTEASKIRNAGGKLKSSTLVSSNAAAILKTDLPISNAGLQSSFLLTDATSQRGRVG